jgi:hypothetical protein
MISKPINQVGDLADRHARAVWTSSVAAGFKWHHLLRGIPAIPQGRQRLGLRLAVQLDYHKLRRKVSVSQEFPRLNILSGRSESAKKGLACDWVIVQALGERLTICLAPTTSATQATQSVDHFPAFR